MSTDTLQLLDARINQLRLDQNSLSDQVRAIQIPDSKPAPVPEDLLASIRYAIAEKVSLIEQSEDEATKDYLRGALSDLLELEIRILSQADDEDDLPARSADGKVDVCNHDYLDRG